LAEDFLADFLALDFFLAAGMVTSSPSSLCSGGHALQSPAFPFAHATPHPIPLVATQGVIQALDANRTVGADPLGLSRRPALLGKKDLRVVVPATCAVLPWNEVVHGQPPELHCCNSDGNGPGNASPKAELFQAVCFVPYHENRGVPRRDVQGIPALFLIVKPLYGFGKAA
jgi:hypothetical protein